MLGTILGNVDGITLSLDVGTELVSLDESFDGSNCGNIEGFLHGESLVSTDVKMLGSGKIIKLGLSGGKVLGTLIGNVYIIILGLDARTYLGSLDD